MPRTVVRILEAASAVLLAVLAVNAALELFVWMLWQRSFAALDEIQAILMVWFGMLAAASCLAEGLHLAVDVLGRRLAHRGRRAVATASALATVLFGSLLSVHGWRLVLAIENTLPGTGWSAALGYQPVAIAGLLIAAIGLWQVRSPPPTIDPSGPRTA